MAAEGYIGAGDLYLAVETAGVIPTELDGPFFINKFELQPAVTLLDNKSKGKTSYGQNIATVALPEPSQFIVEMKNADRQGLVLALAGADGAFTQVSGSLTAVDVAAKKGKWVSVGKQGLTGNPTLTNTGATTTYVLGTDYIVNADLGLIKVLPTSAIVENAVLKFTSTYGALDGFRIRGAVNSQIRARFLFDGKNYVTGKPFQAEIFQGVVAASAAFDFLAEQFNPIPLTGRMETPTGKTEPFIVTSY